MTSQPDPSATEPLDDSPAVATARWLVSPEATDWIGLAEAQPDPSSLAAATALRRDLPGQRAAAVLDLVALRRRATAKLGSLAHHLFLTHTGLEQATRWPVALWRAEQIAAWGVTRLIDAGCGLGVDSLACLANGVSVIGIERDPVTAVYAQANMSAIMKMGRPTPSLTGDVITAEIEQIDLTSWLDDPMTGFFLDPARRTSHGRSWKVTDLTPSWDDVQEWMRRASGPVVVKLGPGFPRRLLPDTPDVTWVSHHHDLVETTVWSTESAAGIREAVLLNESSSQEPPRPPDVPSRPRSHGQFQDSRLTGGVPLPPAGPLGRYLYEPDPAVIRAEATGTLAGLTGTHPVADGIAYLTGDAWTPTDFATGFAIESTMAWSERDLRHWAHDMDVGVMEIKTRGIDLDPAVLRRRLKLHGKNHTCVILTPTVEGATAIIARRLGPND